MRINIINLDKDGWILTKFAKNLFYNLKKIGHNVSISRKAREDVDVNHYIIFLFQKENEDSYFLETVNTTMLTHVNDEFRYNKAKNISKFMDAGITFSNDHLKSIKSRSLGFRKLFFVLPPTDSDLKLKKINLGIFTNLYRDGRKSEEIFVETMKSFSPEFFKITVIGKGWQIHLKKMREMGFEVDYQRFFFRRRYVSKLNQIDYLIYLGNDEGSMSFLDALQLGIKSIVIPQGFQKDLEKFITFKLDKNLKNFSKILEKIVGEKKKFLEVNKTLTWENYAKKHIKIWSSLLKN